MTDMKGSTSKSTDIRALQKEWDEVTCPICMDHPHNAVLLICSSHKKGCRSYICDTSYRHSNCLDRFRKLRFHSTDDPSHGSSFHESINRERNGQRASHALASESLLRDPRTRRNLAEIREDYSLEGNNITISAGFFEGSEGNNNNSQVSDRLLEAHVEERISSDESGGRNRVEENPLRCPLCRGSVMGWLIVKEARQYLDQKVRSCSRETCSFSGNYRELRGHARRMHPMTRPADVDPSRQRAWRRLERQREYRDILSAIRSATPGAIVLGDYVIDNGDEFLDDRQSGEGNGQWWTSLFLFQMIRSPVRTLDESRGSRTRRRHRHSPTRHNLWGENLVGLADDDNERNAVADDIPLRRQRLRFMRSRSNERRRP